MTRFTNDEVGILAPVMAMLRSGRIPATSGFQFTMGVRIPPLVTFLLAVPAAASSSPAWIAGWVAVLNGLAVVFVYLTALEIAGSELAAAVAGGLYAVNPAAVFYGRMIPNTELVPFFCAVALFGLVRFWCAGRPLGLAVSLTAIAWAVQLHLVAAPFALLWLGVALARRKDIRAAPLAIAIVVALLPLAPYLYAQTQPGSGDLAQLAAFARGAGRTDLSALLVAGALAGPAVLQRLSFPFDFSPAYDPWTWLSLVLVGAGAAAGLRRRVPGAWLPLVWFALPVLASLRHSIPIAPFYFLSVIPALAVLQGLAAPLLRRAVKSLVTLPGAWSVAWLDTVIPLLLAAAIGGGGAVRYVAIQSRAADSPEHADYLAPWRYADQAAAQIRDQPGSDDLYLAAPPLESEVMPYLTGQTRAAFVGPSLFVVPSRPSLYSVQHDSFAREFLAEHFAPEALVPTAGGPAYELFRLTGNADRAVLASAGWLPVRADFGPSISLEAVSASELAAGRPSPVQLAWRIRDAAELGTTRVSQFAHLVDRDGQVWSTDADLWNLDVPGSDGQLVVSHFDLGILPSAPLGGYWLETGFYETFSGRALGSPARVGPLRVSGSQPAALPDDLGTFGQDEIRLSAVSWQGDDVTLQWRALKQPAASYVVFVHVLDATGRVAGQHDGLPQDASYPTNLWQAGDAVVDVHHVGVSSRPGLELEIGLYTLPNVGRVPVQVPGQQASSDRVLVRELACCAGNGAAWPV